jgi:hypothetical protein
MKKMKIEAYSFGKMIYNGKTYTSDLIIYPERVDPSWWRQEGHLLQLRDLTDILKEEPDIFIIGTGYMGILKVPPELKEHLERKGIDVHVERSRKAVKVFNRIDKVKKVIAAFHLTC